MELNRGVKRKLNFKNPTFSYIYEHRYMDASNIVYKREQEREMSYYKHPTFISK